MRRQVDDLASDVRVLRLPAVGRFSAG